MRLTVLRQSGESGGFGGSEDLSVVSVAPDRGRRCCRIAWIMPRGRIPRNAKLPRRSGRVAILAPMHPSTDACALRAVDASPPGHSWAAELRRPGSSARENWEVEAYMTEVCICQPIYKSKSFHFSFTIENTPPYMTDVQIEPRSGTNAEVLEQLYDGFHYVDRRRDLSL